VVLGGWLLRAVAGVHKSYAMHKSPTVHVTCQLANLTKHFYIHDKSEHLRDATRVQLGYIL
jgi:hypothetical protein